MLISPNFQAVLRKLEKPTEKALNHFDDFYKEVYSTKWENIKKALLAEKKYIAIVNNFGDSEAVISDLEKLGALNIRKLFEVEKRRYVDREARYLENVLKNEQKSKDNEEISSDFENNESNSHLDELENECVTNPVKVSNNLDQLNSNRLVDINDALSTEILHEFVPATKIKGKEDFVSEASQYNFYDANSEVGVKIEKQYDFNFPEHLKIFCFEKDNYSSFKPPKKAITGVYNYYLMDGGSLLPVLALDVRPGCRILDMCASPGGKSLLTIQTLYPISVISNDVSQSRLHKVHGAYNQFLFDFNEKWLRPAKVQLTNLDGRFIPEGSYDRILVRN